jgi:pimeloyl-ACP methyl ester carboxylesterase
VITEGTAVFDGLTLAYRGFGPAEAVPVLLLHGMGDDARTWDRFAGELASAGRQAIALDQRGHGGSSHPGEYSIDLMRGDVVAFLDHLGIARADLVGHSMGGRVATVVACEHPSRVRRLVVEDAPPPPRSSPWPVSRPDPPDEAPEPVPFDWRLIPVLYREVGRPDPAFWDRVSALTAPTLLVGGGPTSHVPQALLDEFAAELADVRSVQVDAGHHIHTNGPDEFARAVLPFLAPG